MNRIAVDEQDEPVILYIGPFIMFILSSLSQYRRWYNLHSANSTTSASNVR